MVLYVLILKVLFRIVQILNHRKCVYVLRKSKVSFHPSIKFYGETLLSLSGQVSIGKNFISRSGIRNCINSGKSKIVVKSSGELTIGDNSGMSNTCIHCSEKIEIGDNVNIGSGTQIFDTDFHSTSWQDRLDRQTDVLHAKTAPVSIGDCVFIGANCIITKGVDIGARSIIAAGSVVVKNVPSDELWGGNPAMFIRRIG